MPLIPVSSIGQVQVSDSARINANIKQQNNSEGKVVTFSQDKVNFNVEKGILPAFKGAGVGIVGGAVGGAGAAAIALAPALMAGGEGPAWAMLGVVAAGAVGAGAGAIVGGVVANVTDNKVAGTLAGAGAGALAGVLWGLPQGNVLMSAIVGAGAGAGAGFAGALVAKAKH